MKEATQIIGPAMLTEDETTIIVSSSRDAVTCGDGTIVVFAKPDESRT